MKPAQQKNIRYTNLEAYKLKEAANLAGIPYRTAQKHKEYFIQVNFKKWKKKCKRYIDRDTTMKILDAISDALS